MVLLISNFYIEHDKLLLEKFIGSYSDSSICFEKLNITTLNVKNSNYDYGALYQLKNIQRNINIVIKKAYTSIYRNYYSNVYINNIFVIHSTVRAGSMTINHLFQRYPCIPDSFPLYKSH